MRHGHGQQRLPLPIKCKPAAKGGRADIALAYIMQHDAHVRKVAMTSPWLGVRRGDRGARY